jgi:hypothetical protein
MNNEEIQGKSFTPVLFLVFNRPQLTEKVFAQVKKIRPGKIIYSCRWTA